MCVASRLSILSIILVLFSVSWPAQAELKDGVEVPTAPRAEAERYTWTISGAERYHLPILKDGPGKGFFAYYESRGFYRAFVTEDGALEIEMLDRNNASLGNRFELGGTIAGSYTITNKLGRPQSVPRYMVRTKDEYRPQDQPRRKIIIEAILEDDVRFKRTYDFDRDKISVVTGLDCKNSKKTHATMGAWFPAIAKFENLVPQSEREKALEGNFLTIRHVEGRKKTTETYLYSKSAKWGGVADEVKVTGPWGPRRTLELKTRTPVMRPHIYSGNCPYEGYRMYITVPADTYNKFDYKLDISISD